MSARLSPARAARAARAPLALLAFVALPALASLVWTRGVAAQECRPPTDSHEAKLLAFYSAPMSFSPLGAPERRRPGSVVLGVEVSPVPVPPPGLERTSFCYNGKVAQTRLAAAFPRPRVVVALPAGLALEGSYLPPVTVADAQPNLGSVALSYARNRVRGPLFLSTATTLPFLREFDIATLFDVIEHVADDVALLVEARAVLRAGGHVVVTVPAGPRLWTTYDEVIGHKRRYDRDVLISALTRAGLRVRYVSYFNTALFLAGAVRQSPRRRPDVARNAVDIVRRALRVPPAPINTLLRLSVKAEAPLRRLSWVRGGSLIAIAQRMD